MKKGPVPTDLAFLCGVISPWTGEEDAERLRETARSGRVNWEEVAVLANRSNLAPALRVALRTRGPWADAPVELRAYLDEIYRFNARRNALLRRELLEVATLLNGAGITPMPLKGAAALATGLFTDPAIRFMWDQDVLVPDEKIRHAVHALEAAGYLGPEECSAGAAGREALFRARHFASLIGPGAAAGVELHRLVVSDEWSALLDTEAVWRESSLLGSTLLPGVCLAVMSPTHQVVHCFIHSELAHGNHRACRLDLRQLHHFAHLCMHFRDRVDWERVAALREQRDAGRALSAYLHAAQELLGVETPLSSKPDARARRHLSEALSLAQGRRKWLRVSRDVLDLLTRCLSEQRLRDCFFSDGCPTARWRRLHRLGVLFRRYSRLGAWKEVIRAKSRRYDLLG